MHRIRFLSLLVIPALLAVTAGCSSTTRVNGKVTYNGKPVTGGTLTIAPKNTKSPPVTVQLNENGEFECVAPLGEAIVSVDNRHLMLSDKGPIGQSGNYSVRRPEGDGKPGGAPPGSRTPGMGGRPGGGRPGGAPGAGGDAGQGPAQMPSDDPSRKKAMEAAGAPSSFGGNKQAGTYMDIPKKYYTASTSDYTVTIKSGEPLNIELKD
jgi:hypothetical protein